MGFFIVSEQHSCDKKECNVISIQGNIITDSSERDLAQVKKE
jgi:hypothetical protein